MNSKEEKSVNIGTPLTSSALKVMMLGSGELGKEVVIEFQRYGVEVIAVDRYDVYALRTSHRPVRTLALKLQRWRTKPWRRRIHRFI